MPSELDKLFRDYDRGLVSRREIIQAWLASCMGVAAFVPKGYAEAGVQLPGRNMDGTLGGGPMSGNSAHFVMSENRQASKPPTALHTAVKKLVGDKAALVISKLGLRGLLIKNFTNAVSSPDSASVSIEGYPKVQCRFAGINVKTNDFSISLTKASNSDVTVHLTPNFFATIDLHAAGDPKKKFSTITYTISNATVKLIASPPNLMLGAFNYDIATKIDKSSTRSQALTDTGMSDDDIFRIEGAMAYVMPDKV